MICLTHRRTQFEKQSFKIEVPCDTLVVDYNNPESYVSILFNEKGQTIKVRHCQDRKIVENEIPVERFIDKFDAIMALLETE